MLQFICDSCARVKPANEVWILGLAAEAIGLTAARREATIVPAWIRETAVHPLAIHFCSGECKRNYMNELFAEPAQDAEVEETITRAKVAPKKRSRRAKSSARSRRRKKAA